MESLLRLGTIYVACLALLFIPCASAFDADTALHNWQVRRLMQPTQRELRDEAAGKIYIYDGLTDREVEQALDGHFERIGSMMFMGTVKTDEAGKVLMDAQTGKPLQESGGCGN